MFTCTYSFISFSIKAAYVISKLDEIIIPKLSVYKNFLRIFCLNLRIGLIQRAIKKRDNNPNIFPQKVC